PAVGTLVASSSTLTDAIHLSKSGRAAFLRSSVFALIASTSFESASQRLRSSLRGTNMIGGVSLTFPSIARCVVLLKNADIAEKSFCLIGSNLWLWQTAQPAVSPIHTWDVVSVRSRA